MVLADGFASSPAGFLSGVAAVFVIVIVPVAAFMGKRMLDQNVTRFEKVETTLDKHSESLSVQTRALSVLIAEVAPTQKLAAESADHIVQLGKDTAVLKSRLDRHEEWSAGELKDVRGALVSLRTIGQASK